jgi:hypothetical protein
MDGDPLFVKEALGHTEIVVDSKELMETLGDALPENVGELVRHKLKEEVGLIDLVTLLHWVVVPEPL